MTTPSLLGNLFAANGDPHNFRIVEVPGDGSCLFHSLSRALFGDLRHSLALRRMATEVNNQPLADPNRWGTADDLEKIETRLDIKALLLSTTVPSGGADDESPLPRVLGTAYGDGSRAETLRFVVLAYDEGHHFRPVTYLGRGAFGINELPWLVRSLAARSLPPFREAMLRAVRCHPQQ